MNTRILGQNGETMAAQFLQAAGYQILKQNYRNRYGELDIIAQTPDMVLAFVEVKTRRGIKQGSGREAVTVRKQHTIARMAQCYLQETSSDVPCRFDIIEIQWHAGEPTLVHIENAFSI